MVLFLDIRKNISKSFTNLSIHNLLTQNITFKLHQHELTVNIRITDTHI